MKRYVALFSCFLSLCMLLWAFPLRANPDPTASIRLIQQALDTRDLSLFERVVDVDGLIDQALTILIEKIKHSAQNGDALPSALTLMAYSLQNESSASAIRAMLKKELGIFIRSGIKTGQLHGYQQEYAQPEGVLARFLPEISGGTKTLRITGFAPMDADGNYTVPVSLEDAGNGHSYPLQLVLFPQKEGWQVREIKNMPELFYLLEQESQKK